MLTPVTLATERLVLVPLRVEDAEPMVGVVADERMYAFTGGRAPTAAELRDRYERLAVGRSADGSELWFNWIVRVDGQSAPVGAMQATVSSDGATADVAWEIGVEWQGRGFGGEAARAVVRWLRDGGVAVVRALVHPDHVASNRVAQHAGLQRTGEIEDGEVVWRWPTP